MTPKLFTLWPYIREIESGEVIRRKITGTEFHFDRLVQEPETGTWIVTKEGLNFRIDTFDNVVMSMVPLLASN